QSHNPMYFFLRNLSFLELCSITATVPKALENIWSTPKPISFTGCAFQMFAFLAIAVCECVILLLTLVGLELPSADIPPVLSLVCASTLYVEISVFIACIMGAVIPFILIMCSYIRILSAILLTHSPEGRHKAMSTCGPHLVSVIIFYGTAMFVHLRLGSHGSTGNDRMVALFYCIIIPAINPLIYSFRNNDVKKAPKGHLH
ncbi:hypothetical protein GDO86_018865, partial [Hymenochirus boettgeri]